jgi:hypothetical protein
LAAAVAVSVYNTTLPAVTYLNEPAAVEAIAGAGAVAAVAQTALVQLVGFVVCNPAQQLVSNRGSNRHTCNTRCAQFESTEVSAVNTLICGIDNTVHGDQFKILQLSAGVEQCHPAPRFLQVLQSTWSSCAQLSPDLATGTGPVDVDQMEAEAAAHMLASLGEVQQLLQHCKECTSYTTCRVLGVNLRALGTVLLATVGCGGYLEQTSLGCC